MTRHDSSHHRFHLVVVNDASFNHTDVAGTLHLCQAHLIDQRFVDRRFEGRNAMLYTRPADLGFLNTSSDHTLKRAA